MVTVKIITLVAFGVACFSFGFSLANLIHVVRWK